MSFYGGNQNGGQPGSNPQQQLGRQAANPGLQNVQQVLTPQLFNINVNPGQLHNFFNEHGSSQGSLQLNAAAAAAAANQSILLQPQQSQTFPVNLINEQLGVGVGQLISSATVSQSQMQGLPISMSSALNFSQALQVHGQTTSAQQSQAQNQQPKQRVFTGTVTKVHDNFGFIDEEVFFQMGVVKGPILPKEGDRVLVEADFNSNMPFKWNATRVQIVNIGGGISSSLNSLPSISTSQQQHMGFSTSVGLQKQANAPPPPPPLLTSQSGNARPHGAQPVTIVSNPHSVYSGGNNPRGRVSNVGAPVPAPGNSIGNPQRDTKRPLGHMPLVPDPPSFISNAPVTGLISSERELERDRERSRERQRERSRERPRDHARERSRDRARGRSRERSRDRGRDRSRDRDKNPRNRSRSRERVPRDRSRDRTARGSSRERVPRERSADRSSTSRVRSRSRDRNMREGSQDRREKVKHERTPEKQRERQRDKETNKDKERKKSMSPANKHAKDGKNKEKGKASNERGKSTRERSPSSSIHGQSQTSERSKRSRSKESVRTDKGHGPAERSRSRSTSPRRTRPAPRYAVEIPKFSLDTKDINVKEIQRRYPNLYVPSDFFLAKSAWMDTFPLDQPFELGHACPVQIMRKSVQKINIPNPEYLEERFGSIPDILEPADASYTFKAKVMIPSMGNLETIYRKSCGVTDDGTDPPDSPQHFDRLISFVVGMKTSKHEVMALGGPWSPSLDGANPQSDPQTLINTAIRSVRALTGVNLSRCKHWYRFMELYYKRSNCLETVVFYLPDVWSSLPGSREWSKLKSVYKYALYGEKNDVADKIGSPKSDSEVKSSTNKGTEDDPVVGGDQSRIGASLSDEGGDTGRAEVRMKQQEDDVMNNSGLLVIDEAASPAREDGGLEDQRTESIVSVSSIPGGSQGTDTNAGMETEENQTVGLDFCVTKTNEVKLYETTKGEEASVGEKGGVSSVVNGENLLPAPTHFSLITPKSMNVAQLKDELIRRNLSPKGLKSQLATRLVKALKDEESQEKEVQKMNEQLAKEESTEVDTAECISQENACEENQPLKPNEGGLGEDEHDIRIVNPSLILESQDDETSVDDVETKEQCTDDSSQFSAECRSILSGFPADTFPVIKTGMKDEEVKMWERRYILPKNPRMLVFPSTVAKSGNFDCLSMTLALLRDYRIIDKKEDNFEVSLFAEFFNEMLQRDFAFRIYMEIVAESGKLSSETDNLEKESGSKDDKTEKEGEPATKKRKLSSTSVGISSVTTKKTTDPFLLLSFIFFDVTRCGYITETDLEDLCSCIGLGLTRCQIRKVVQKVVHKGTLYYRKWTDRAEKSNCKLQEDLRTLSQGNKAYFPVFVLQENGHAPISKSEMGVESEDSKEAVIAVVDGRDVDVKKLLDQLDKCEKDLTVAESSLNVMKNSLNEAKSQVTDLRKTNDSLKDELVKIKDTLKKSENSEKTSKENVEIFRRSTERFLERIKDLVKFPSSNCKEKSETSSKDSAKPKDKSSAEQKEKSKSNHESSQSESNPATSKELSNISADNAS